MAVVVNKKQFVSCCLGVGEPAWCGGGGCEHLSPLWREERHFWPLWHTYVRFSVCLFVCVCVCVCVFAPTEVYCRISHSRSPPLALHLSPRDTDDPEVSLQLQRELHRPPHLGVHALAAEDGARAPEPPAGQPGGHGDQHRYADGIQRSQAQTEQTDTFWPCLTTQRIIRHLHTTGQKF